MIENTTTSPTLLSRVPIASLAVVAVLVVAAGLVGQTM